MYWIVPVLCYPQEFQPQIQPQQVDERKSDALQRMQGDEVHGWNPNPTFKVLFKKQLLKREERKPKKIWTAEEDRILLILRKQGKTWEEISKRVSNGSEVKCKRRHERLVKEMEKWPSQVDCALKKLHEVDGLSWQDLRSYISQNFLRNYSLKSIRERYVNTLRDGIDKNPWALEEDLKLLGVLCEFGREWQSVANHFPSRSERHIKNRFSCTLEPVLKKIRKRKCFKELGEKIQSLIRPS